MTDATQDTPQNPQGGPEVEALELYFTELTPDDLEYLGRWLKPPIELDRREKTKHLRRRIREHIQAHPNLFPVQDQAPMMAAGAELMIALPIREDGKPRYLRFKVTEARVETQEYLLDFAEIPKRGVIGAIKDVVTGNDPANPSADPAKDPPLEEDSLDEEEPNPNAGLVGCRIHVPGIPERRRREIAGHFYRAVDGSDINIQTEATDAFSFVFPRGATVDEGRQWAEEIMGKFGYPNPGQYVNVKALG